MLCLTLDCRAHYALAELHVLQPQSKVSLELSEDALEEQMHSGGEAIVGLCLSDDNTALLHEKTMRVMWHHT